MMWQAFFFLKNFSFSFLCLPLLPKIVLSTSFENDFGKKFGTPSNLQQKTQENKDGIFNHSICK
jgi:hypothetical protein